MKKPDRAHVVTTLLCLVVIFACSSPAAAQTCNVPPATVDLGGGCGAPKPVLSIAPPVIGGDLDLLFDSEFPNAPFILFVSPGIVTPLAFPFGNEICLIYINITNFLFLGAMTDANGDVALSFPLPNNPALAGVLLTFQARAWAPGGIFDGDHFSNGVLVQIGCPGVLGEIGDTVFCDANDNGVQDPGDAGIPGVTVDLACDNGYTATTMTDANGNYLFENLPAGTCTVTVDASTAPGDKTPGTNCPTSVSVSLTQGQSFLDADFCFIDRGQIGDTIFCDTDDDGVQDAGEPGIPGVTVNLSCAGGFTATAVTDSDGKYLFDDLLPDTCTVTVDAATVPADKRPGTNCPASFTVTLTAGQSFLDADFCYVNSGEIGDTVFCDLNGNGVLDAGEPGIAGVVVNLSCSISGISATTTTDSNGTYLFGDLPGGETCTVTVDPSTAPSDKVPGPGCPTEIPVMLAPGQSFLDADFCFVVCGECDGKVTSLTLRYLGNQVNALIEVENGSVFSGTVQPGDLFSFSGLNSDGTFPSSIDITVNGGAATSIHTSCSQPIGPGLVVGNFEVVAGTSRNGGALCPLMTCDFGKPCSLTLLYTGDDCSATSTMQDPSKVSCSGDPMSAAQVMILCTDKSNPSDASARVWFNGTVDLNDTFTAEALVAGESRFRNETFVHILDLQGTLLQSVEFHTSCSQPLRNGDQFGAVMLVDYSAEGLCPLPPGVDACDVLGDPQILTMQYTGEDCSSTNTMQDPSKVSCSGDPAMAPLVNVRASDKANPNDTGAKVWFSGSVALNGTFAIDATSIGQDKLSTVTFVHIFDPTTGALLQELEFHTSCSQPLRLNDQFGSCLLIGFVGN